MFDLHIYCALRRNSVNKGFGLWIPMARQEFNRRVNGGLIYVPAPGFEPEQRVRQQVDLPNDSAGKSSRLPRSRHILCRARESEYIRTSASAVRITIEDTRSRHILCRARESEYIRTSASAVRITIEDNRSRHILCRARESSGRARNSTATVCGGVIFYYFFYYRLRNKLRLFAMK